ncbi:MAG: hypothetical protein II275_10245 [Bacteroidaceae bacterium]|nr:hypothetical protein [Bacteroidaceae bacterium]
MAVGCWRSTPTVILNSFQDLTEDWAIKARGQMLKQVQHDNMISPSKLGFALA